MGGERNPETGTVRGSIRGVRVVRGRVVRGQPHTTLYVPIFSESPHSAHRSPTTMLIPSFRSIYAAMRVTPATHTRHASRGISSRGSDDRSRTDVGARRVKYVTEVDRSLASRYRAPPPNGERSLLFSASPSACFRSDDPRRSCICQSCDDKTPQSCDARQVMCVGVCRERAAPHTSAQRLRTIQDLPACGIHGHAT